MGDINENILNDDNVENKKGIENIQNLENNIEEQFEDEKLTDAEVSINSEEELKTEEQNLNIEKDEVQTKEEIESSINELDETIIKEQSSEDNSKDKNKYQIEEDKLSCERNLLAYKEWFLKVKELVLKSMKTFDNVNLIVDKFNDEISKKIEILSDQDKKLIENRIKGINMIKKMSNNSLNNSLRKLSDTEELDFSDIKIISEFENKSDDEIRMILNQNYSNISHIESEKLNLINKYFDFIEGSLLPIIDGVESGISYVRSLTNEIIENEILPIYIDLKKCFDELLENMNVIKIEIETKTKINFASMEVLDIQETEDDNLDEVIESVVRNGYEYTKDIYGGDHNHIIRKAQIVAYKVIK